MSKNSEDSEEIKDEKKKKKERNLSYNKIILRRLPPGMNKEQFLEIVKPLPDHDFFRFVTGDKSLAPNNYARAYLNFVNIDDIVPFRDAYDGREFETENGSKSVCIMEYAPFQKVPKKNRKKEDPKCGTLEKDPDYIKFLETLEVEEEKQGIDIEQFLEELDERDKSNQNPVDTPLTSFIKQRREERKRVRDERKRQEIERRKKKDEERRKRREMERRQRLESDKNKKEHSAKEENGGKKTLGETKRDLLENNRSRNNSESKSEDSSKVKILQKQDKEAKSSSNVEDIKQGVFTASELEEVWADDYALEWPKLIQNEEVGEKRESYTRHKESKYRPQSTREFGARKWKDGSPSDNRPFSAKTRDPVVDCDKKDDKIKNKKPERKIYQAGAARGRGSYRGGRGSRPQKYSEQRSHVVSKNGNEK